MIRADNPPRIRDAFPTRTRWLAVALVASLAVLFTVAPNDPGLMRFIHRVFDKPSDAAALVNEGAVLDDDPRLAELDPKPGHVLSEKGRALLAVASEVESPKSHVFVYLSGCGSCGRESKVTPGDLEALSSVRYAVLLSPGGEAEEARRIVGAGPRVVTDGPDGRLVTELNCYFGPRVYVFDSEWKLVAVQKKRESVAAFLKGLPRESLSGGV